MDGFLIAEAFAQFTDTELSELKTYRNRVRQLSETGFAKQKEHTFKLFGSDQPVISQDDKDRLVGALPYYRKLDMLNDPGSFERVRNLLARHAHARGTPSSAFMAGKLKELKHARRLAHEESNWFGYREEGEAGPPRKIPPAFSVDLFTYGEIIHDDDPERVAAFEASGGWRNPAHVMHLSSTVATMLTAFKYLDAIVRDVLECTELRALPSH
jgi:hypothetical protein